MRLALHALQPRLDHRPLGGVDHDRHARDVGLRGDEVQEAHHRGFRIEHALVHVDVDDLRAARHLLARDVERGGVVAGLDELAELRGAGDVGALADVHEQRVLADVERLETREPALRRRSRALARRVLGSHGLADQPDVLRRRAAAAADDVEQAGCGELRRIAAVSSGVSSYSPNAFGRPAFG